MANPQDRELCVSPCVDFRASGMCACARRGYSFEDFYFEQEALEDDLLDKAWEEEEEKIDYERSERP